MIVIPESEHYDVLNLWNSGAVNRDTLAVFDVDGTLIDSAGKLRSDVIGAFERLGIHMSDEEARKIKNWYETANEYGISKEHFDEAFDKRKSWEQSLRDGEAPIFADTLPCLDRLASKGVRLAALTKSNQEYTKSKIDFYGLGRYFGDRVAVTPVTSKNKELEAHTLIEKEGGNFWLQGAYFIGDSPIDVTVAPIIRDRFRLHTQGIYLNRESKPVPEEVRFYSQITSLDELV